MPSGRRDLQQEGSDFTRRFQAIAAAVLALPARSCVIDGELIAADAYGQPDFGMLLHGRSGHVHVCVYAFDLMELRWFPATALKVAA